MVSDDSDNPYRGLQALSASAFPRHCPNCGRRFDDLQAFIANTQPAGKQRGLKAARDDDEQPLLELYRNCRCGSTLMDFCGDRRADPDRRAQHERKIKQYKGGGDAQGETQPGATAGSSQGPQGPEDRQEDAETSFEK